MGEIICAQCGHRNDSEANFCSSCGARLDAAEHTAAVPVVGPGAAVADLGDDGEDEAFLTDLPAGMGVLIVRHGPSAGSRYALSSDLTRAGRHPDSDIFLDDITVSRRHVEVSREGDQYRVRDVGSLNGTYLNRERVEAGVLAAGDELQIGKFKLAFLQRGPDDA